MVKKIITSSDVEFVDGSEKCFVVKKNEGSKSILVSQYLIKDVASLAVNVSFNVDRIKDGLSHEDVIEALNKFLNDLKA